MFDRNQSKEFELTPELAALEQQLVGLDVTPLQVDRDWLMFEAGRAAARPGWPGYMTGASRAGGWFWPSATAMMTAASLILAAMLIWRDDSAIVAHQPPHRPRVDGESGTETPMERDFHNIQRLANRPDGTTRLVRPAGGYLEKRHIALTRGVSELRNDDASQLSLPTDRSEPPATARELLRELVPERDMAGQSRS